ncbi:hypothetical protein N658DRAFT_510637 [Parathielavia hyrcaniae]|uniref:Uncharacterized protein n=1 Tax=Parathielavia hyrcaniae TaxID=113614 RepID=A0AAN6SX53_9PEZI|nr:hypothetical protein N658DRAFT_510637 [Parathielavia hyrcaniae]
MATAFGVFTGILTVIGFIQSNTPDRPNQYETKFRIHVALDNPHNGPSNAGGDAPDIRVWNQAGQFLGGTYDPGRVSSGSFRDVTVRLSQPHQPTYALFTGNDDAICIAYITNSWADGQKYAWVGNWADSSSCRQSWYYSNIVLDGKSLNCAWIDRNGDLPKTAFQTHIHEFADVSANQGKGVSYYCGNNPSLKWYEHWEPNSISYWVTPRKRGVVEGGGPWARDAEDAQTAVAVGPVKPGSENRKKLSGARPAFNETRLVRSSRPEHSAVTLCESDSSAGPDLVSLHEGKFCDMKTREILPLCDGPGVASGDCFDDSIASLRVRGGARLSGRDVAVDTKEYSEVLEWGA